MWGSSGRETVTRSHVNNTFSEHAPATAVRCFQRVVRNVVGIPSVSETRAYANRPTAPPAAYGSFIYFCARAKTRFVAGFRRAHTTGIRLAYNASRPQFTHIARAARPRTYRFRFSYAYRRGPIRVRSASSVRRRRPRIAYVSSNNRTVSADRYANTSSTTRSNSTKRTTLVENNVHRYTFDD